MRSEGGRIRRECAALRRSHAAATRVALALPPSSPSGRPSRGAGLKEAEGARAQLADGRALIAMLQRERLAEQRHEAWRQRGTVLVGYQDHQRAGHLIWRCVRTHANNAVKWDKLGGAAPNVIAQFARGQPTFSITSTSR